MPRVGFDLEARRPYLVQAFTDAEYDRRVAALCGRMAREGLDALIVYANAASPSAVAYLTNYAPAFGNAFVVLHRNGRVTVATDAVLIPIAQGDRNVCCSTDITGEILGQENTAAAEEVK